MNPTIFKTRDFNFQFYRTLGKATVNFAEIGECFTIAEKIEEGNVNSWFTNWFQFAEKLEENAHKCLGNGHLISAKHLFFRASEYYRQSTFFHRVNLDCKELQLGFHRHKRSLIRGFELTDYKLIPFNLEYNNKKLYGYRVINVDSELTLPTIVSPSGYDSTAEEMVYMIGISALERGYNLILFDGPGQGNTLYDPENRLYMTDKYEKVLNKVVDYAMDFKEFDKDKLILMGLSFGGFLMPKAATEESRISAIILDPGQLDMGMAINNVLPQYLKDILHENSKEAEEKFNALASNLDGQLFLYPRMSAHGISSIREYLNLMYDYKIDRQKLKNIKCPVLVCDNEADSVSTEQGKELFDRLECPKKFIEFKNADGAGGHCEITGRQIFFQKAFDWLDELFI